MIAKRGHRTVEYLVRDKYHVLYQIETPIQIMHPLEPATLLASSSLLDHLRHQYQDMNT